MKRAIALLMILMMASALCGCGSGNTETPSGSAAAEAAVSAPETPEAEAEAPEEEAQPLVEFTDVILVDDDVVTIELVNFYAEDTNWSSGTQNEKIITVRATNNSDHEIVVNPGSFYLNDEEAYVSMKDGSMSPAPGKSGSYRYLVALDTSPEHTALDSIDDLYDLEGDFDVLCVYDDSSKNTYYDASFDIRAAINGETAAEETPAVIYDIGETVSTDAVEFTLTGFDYVYHLDPKTYAEKEDISGGAVGPGSDMVFANPEYTVKNISKDEIRARDAATFTVDYNDGYTYGMDDGKVCYIVDAPGVAWKWASRNSGEGAVMSLSPLTDETYNAYIPAIDLIDTDAEAAVRLIVTLATSTGTEDFIYQIK